MTYVACIDSGAEPDNFIEGKVYKIGEEKTLTNEKGHIYTGFASINPSMSVGEAWVAWVRSYGIKFKVLKNVVRRF